MAEGVGVNSQAEDSPASGDNVSLNAAIAFVGDFTASAQIFEMGVGLVLMAVSGIAMNDARIAGLERNLLELSRVVANLSSDDLYRPIGSGGGGDESSAPTSTQFN